MIETLTQISLENLPNWTAFFALIPPAISAVLFKLDPNMDMKFLRQTTSRLGNSYPDGQRKAGISISDDGKNAMLPSGAEGALELSINSIQFEMTVFDIKRRNPVNEHPGHAGLSYKNECCDLQAPNKEVEIFPGLTATYVWTPEEVKAK